MLSHGPLHNHTIVLMIQESMAQPVGLRTRRYFRVIAATTEFIIFFSCSRVILSTAAAHQSSAPPGSSASAIHFLLHVHVRVYRYLAACRVVADMPRRTDKKSKSLITSVFTEAINRVALFAASGWSR